MNIPQKYTEAIARVDAACDIRPDLTKAQAERCIREFRALHDRLPKHWSSVADFGPAGGAYCHKFQPDLLVIVTASYMDDNRCWLHVSLSERDDVPTYSQLTKVKREFIGPESKAIMVLPAASEHVNLNENVLHLFCCLDADPLPDFTMGSGSI